MNAVELDTLEKMKKDTLYYAGSVKEMEKSGMKKTDIIFSKGKKHEHDIFHYDLFLHYRQFLHMEGIQAAGLERVLHSGKIQTQKGVWD